MYLGTQFAARTDADYETFKQLGVNNIKFIGNLKYYGLSRIKDKDIKFLKKKFQNFNIWCAASTHEGEEILISLPVRTW